MIDIHPFFRTRGLVELLGSYLSPVKAKKVFCESFPDAWYELFVRAVASHTFCDRVGIDYIRKQCYDDADPIDRNPLTKLVRETLPRLQILDLSTFSEPGQLAFKLANDSFCAPIVYYSRDYLASIQKGDEIRKVIDALQNRPGLFDQLKNEKICNKEQLKFALFSALFKRCNHKQAEEFFPWAVTGTTALADGALREKITQQVKKINCDIVAAFHADGSQDSFSQSEKSLSLSQKRAASPMPSTDERNAKRQRLDESRMQE